MSKQVVERLRQPLCVALVGRVSSGKSTLLNALLDTAISPTNGRECTEVVYLFRHGRWESAVAWPRDGSAAQTVDFTNLGSGLPLPATEIRRVDVVLPVPRLEQSILIDTPGLASTQTHKSALTERLLSDTSDAAVRADAVLFCLNGPLKDDESAAVSAFKHGSGGSRLSSGTALGVLTKADMIGLDRRHAWKNAKELAQTMASQHTDLFATVVPVIGLLAQTANTGALREQHARDLAELARAWHAGDVTAALMHGEMFQAHPGPLSADARRSLLDLLGLHGIGVLIEELQGGQPAHAAALTAVARNASGLIRLTSALDNALDSRSDVLKAAAALEQLQLHAGRAGEVGLSGQAQELLDRPEMFPVRVIEMARRLAAGTVRPPDELAAQAWMAITTGLPATASADAMRHATAWRNWAALTDVRGNAVARVMVRAWQLAVDGKRSP
ncbi:dynamin family protein [Lentzea sp. NPDC051213]|uniref:dynamin family protein n=1 Tax=Lentzea sp. NPDC051213 TaxID=3364126 RepID=UPI0037897630